MAMLVCGMGFLAFAVARASTPGSGSEDRSLRPFKVQVPQVALDDLRRRISATRWPDRETVTDRSQGTQLNKLQELVRYWGSGYDWRKAEAKLNALPQFITMIDGVDIHFIHVRSRHENALPVLVVHGWPGSVFEQIKLIGPLTDLGAAGFFFSRTRKRERFLRISAISVLVTPVTSAAGPDP